MNQKNNLPLILKKLLLFGLPMIGILLLFIIVNPLKKKTEVQPETPIITQPTQGEETLMKESTEPIQEDTAALTDTVQSAESSDRVTYQPDFYYEPLSEDVKTRIYGLSYKEDCTVPYEELRYVSVLYKDFENKKQVGEIICNKTIAQDLLEIFYELYQAEYAIAKIRLVDEYNADDTLSCLDNNSSAFNFRVVEGSTTLSKHALGLAMDINPVYNPYVTYPDGVKRISPVGSDEYADRSKDFPHKIDEDDLCYQLFIEHGFTWSGHWKSLQDYQHFQMATED